MLSGEISFRHNVIAIQSLDSFVNIRGGFSHGRKDVYFVRAVGECPDFLKVFETLDSRLTEAEKSNRIRYLRVKSLPNTIDKQTSEFYISAYAEWKQGKQIETRKQSANKNFAGILGNATNDVVEKYKIVRSAMSESIIRNFVIKIWYWTDLFLGEVIKEWSGQLTVKIVPDNIVKPQEYLFFYFATLLGFDVLILNNRADIDINEKVRNLSSELMLGSFGTTELPEHRRGSVSTHEGASAGSRKHDIQGNGKNETSNNYGNGKNETSNNQGNRKNEFSNNQGNRKNEFSNNQENRKNKDLNDPGNKQNDSSNNKRNKQNEFSNNQGNKQTGSSSIQGSGKPDISRQRRQPARVAPQVSAAAPTAKDNSGNQRIPAEKIVRQTVNGNVSAADSRRNFGQSQGNLRQEKTFEELAQLASSIVMIAVHDENGEPTATGSGIMIGKKGFILTNFHVVKRGVIFAVRIEDDEKVYVTGEVIKYNPQLDLAVLRIDRELKPLPVFDGRKKLVRGQRVVAIGSPLGLFNSVSDGIISGFRKIKDVDMIQFTAPISNGSSGGAVLNMYGEIIGISTAGVDSGQNINLAVDYNNIRFFAQGFF